MTYREYVKRWDDPAYIVRVEKLAAALDADGCSGVIDFFLLGCLEHDIAYRTHCNAWGIPITKCAADKQLKWYIQLRSWFGRASPMAWWRWRAVVRLGGKAWNHEPLPFPQV